MESADAALHAQWVEENSAGWTFTPGPGFTLGVKDYTGTVTALTVPGASGAYEVTRLEDEAFMNFQELETLTIPASISFMGKGLCEGCENLNTLTFSSGSSLTSIEERSFKGCASLNTISGFPASISKIGDEAFRNCGTLNSLPFGQFTDIGSLAFAESNLATATPLDLTGLQKLEGGAFMACQNLTQLNLGTDLTDLPSVAFAQSGLESITIPENVTSLGDGCFSGCESLTAITFEKQENITSLGDSCFDGCKALPSITIPENVTSLGNSCFRGCSTLNAITMSDNITSLGKECFKLCIKLSSITIPENVTSLGDTCFAGCLKLASITIPESVTSLGRNCFNRCIFTSITIPGAVTSLRSNCFYRCDNLAEVVLSGAVNPPSLGSSVFKDSYPIHVPHGSLAAYQAHADWNPYVSRLVELP